MKKYLTLAILLLQIIYGHAEAPKEINNVKQIFEKYEIGGSILIFNQNTKEYFGYNLERCNMAFSPASTFKIPNTLIALETSTITTDSIFHWGGEKRKNTKWEADMNIYQAFKVSNVPIYQSIAKTIDVNKMLEYTRLLHFGDMDINTGNIDKFWLEGNSAITQYQQIYFLEKLYNNEFPLKHETMAIVKDMMLFEKTDDYVIRGKTGWVELENSDLGWFVGYVEAENNVYFFATNTQSIKNTNMQNFGQIRIDLTKEILKQLSFIK